MRNTRRQYVAEWAVKAHRSPSDVYVPFALQPASLCLSCGWARRTIPATAGVDGPGNHRNCKEGRW